MRQPSTYAVTSWLFLRLLGVVYLLAFWSLATQILGLVGHDGILPARLYMDGARAFVGAEHIGADRFRLLPTLCWLGTSDLFLRALCLAGAAFASLLIAGIAPALVLALLWVDYLSLSVVGRDFLSFQWDALLLEAGFLAIFIAPLGFRERLRTAVDPPRLAVWLLLWLLCRLMVGSGAVKLASGDPTWHGLTALRVHFETQPLPTPLAWYAHRLPFWLSKTSTAAVMAIELTAPFLMLGPRRLRVVGFAWLVGLQTLIALTGNYAFFNLLTVALCVFLLDDATLKRCVLFRAERPIGPESHSESVGAVHSRGRRALVAGVAIVTLPVSMFVFTGSLGVELPGSSLVAPLDSFVGPFRSVNRYGLFAIMTTTRPEIVVEGSEDGRAWLPYEFKYKPGDLGRRPPWVAPHQPRLDWQMWFAALGGYEAAPWFQSFCLRLLDGSPEVLGLIERDPFHGRPPLYIRGVLYSYQFPDALTHRDRGVWWTRERIGEYSPVLSLRARYNPPADE